MKKVSRSLIAAIAAVLLALALAACGGSDETVNYDGTYRLSAPEDGYYKFMVISGDEMDMYYGTSDDFSAAVKLKNGDFTITRRDSDGIAVTCDALPQLTAEYAAGTENGAAALIDETNERTYVLVR